MWPVLSTCIEAIGIKSTTTATNVSLHAPVQYTTFDVKTVPESVGAIKGERIASKTLESNPVKLDSQKVYN